MRYLIGLSFVLFSSLLFAQNEGLSPMTLNSEQLNYLKKNPDLSKGMTAKAIRSRLRQLQKHSGKFKILHGLESKSHFVFDPWPAYPLGIEYGGFSYEPSSGLWRLESFEAGKRNQRQIGPWTIGPDNEFSPMGMVKVKWVTANQNVDTFVDIITSSFGCWPLQGTNTCFIVDLYSANPRKFKERQSFDEFLAFEVRHIPNGQYFLKLRWRTGWLDSPVFNIAHP